MTQHHFFQSFVHPSLPKLPPFKAFRHSPPSTVHVESLGKGIQQHILHQETQFGANFLPDSDRRCWISSGWWPVRILFSSFRETKTPCHTRGVSPAFLGEWQPTNQPLPHVVLSTNSSCQALSFQCSWRTKSDEAAALKILSWAIHWKGLWVNEICCFNLKEKPAEICSRALLFISETLEFQQFRNKLKLSFVSYEHSSHDSFFKKTHFPCAVIHGMFAMFPFTSLASAWWSRRQEPPHCILGVYIDLICCYYKLLLILIINIYMTY